MLFEEPQRIAKLLQDYTGTWAIAGGWAIDLFLNAETRKHKDIEVFIIRSEQQIFRNYLSHWQLLFVSANQFVYWAEDEYLELPIHEIHGLNNFGEKLEILLNEVKDESWQFRRNPHITYPLPQVIIDADCGIPIVSPEVVLLYKAKFNQEKDLHDLKAALPKLNVSQLNILKQWLKITQGNHEWLLEIGEYTIPGIS